MTIRNKFLIPAVAGLVVLGLVTAALAAEVFSDVISFEVQRNHEAQIEAIRLETALVASRCVELASVIAGLPAVESAYRQAAEGDLDDESDPVVQAARERLRRDLRPIDQRYRRDTGQEALRAHFHFPNARSFLRLWRERQTRRDGRWVDVSDDLSSFRHTVVEVNREGRAIRGVELGRGGFTIRGLVPIEDGRGQQLGSVEVLAPFGEMLAKSLSRPARHFALLMDTDRRDLTTAHADLNRFPEVGDDRQRYVMVMSDDRERALRHIDWELLEQGRREVRHRWNGAYFTSAFPVRDVRDQMIGVVWLATDQSPVLAAELGFQRSVILTATGFTLLLSFVLFIIGRRTLRPLQQTITSMEKIANDAGDLDVRLDVRGQDEIAQLAAAFNVFVERLQRSFGEVTRNTSQILDRVSRFTEDRSESAAPEQKCDPSPASVPKTIGDVTRQTEDIAAKVDDVLSAWRSAETAAEEQRRQLIQADKLASLGVLVAGVAHEINNPNGFIMLNAPTVRQVWDELTPILDQHQEETGELMIGAMPYDKVREQVPTLLEDIESGAKRIQAIVASLKDYARQDPGEQDEQVDLNEVVRAALVLTENRVKKATTSLQLRLAPDLPTFRGSFQRLEQVVVNLILNACDALRSPEEAITIATARGERDGPRLSLTVTDHGAGMSPEVLARIKDPFFTTKRTCGGTGLGLSVSDGIVRDHGGVLEFHSVEGQGTTAALCVPLDHPRAEEEQHDESR
jgi:signal transduction histidine kinase/HAMP domain-containing protein